MGLPDCELEEPSDSEWCWMHTQYQPCPHCRDEAADRAFDTMRDRTLEVRAQRRERSTYK